MKDKRGEFKITSMLFGILLAFGLFFTLIGSIITSLGGMYDTSAYDEDSLEGYSHLNSLSSRLQNQSNSIDTDVSVSSTVFDYFAGIFAKITEPFRFIYRSYATLITASNSAVNDLGLFPEFGVWVQAVLITLVIVGIVMFAVYMKVKQ